MGEQQRKAAPGKATAFNSPIFTTSLPCLLTQCPLHSVGTSMCWVCLHPVQRDAALLSATTEGGPSSGSVQTTQRAFTAARQALCVDPLGAPAVDSGRDIPAAGLQRSQGCESSRLCSMGFLSPSSLWHSLPSLTAFSPRHKPGHSCPPGRSQILPPPSNIFFPQQCFLISSHLFLP